VFIDGLIFWIAEALLWVAAGDSWKQAFGFDGPYSTVDEWTGRDWLIFAAESLASITYFTVMVGKYGGTLGKLALGLRVVKANGEQITYSKSLARDLASHLSVLAFVVTLPEPLMFYLLPCLAGLVMAAFDPKKRALHDRLCGTRVIHCQKES
jgi:uncharacterized RDD family membrane protein YckC